MASLNTSFAFWSAVRIIPGFSQWCRAGFPFFSVNSAFCRGERIHEWLHRWTRDRPFSLLQTAGAEPAIGRACHWRALWAGQRCGASTVPSWPRPCWGLSPRHRATGEGQGGCWGAAGVEHPSPQLSLPSQWHGQGSSASSISRAWPATGEASRAYCLQPFGEHKGLRLAWKQGCSLAQRRAS